MSLFELGRYPCAPRAAYEHKTSNVEKLENLFPNLFLLPNRPKREKIRPRTKISVDSAVIQRFQENVDTIP